MASQIQDKFLRLGPAYVDRDAINLLGQLPMRSLAEVMTATVGESLDKPGLQRWRRRNRLQLQDPLGQQRVFYLKRFCGPSLGTQLARILSGNPLHSTAWVEWDNIRRLEELGVPTMRPAAFAEKMVGPWELASLLCTEQVPGESLEKWLPTSWDSSVEVFGFGWRRSVIEQLARIVRRMHDGRLCHRDLYTSHIFVDLREDGAARFHLIDLQRMIRPWLRGWRWWVKDLAALGASAPAGLVSRTDRLRFLLAYLRREKLDGQAKRWWRAIRAKAARMMRHHEARMARLGGANG